MKRLGFSALWIIFFSIPAISQQVLNDILRFYPIDTTSFHSISFQDYILLQGEVSLNSTSITNDFFTAYNSAEFIGDDLKDQVTTRLNKLNRYGYLLNANLGTGFKLNSRLQLLTGISVRQMNSALFTDDLFNLIFRGNKMYAGREADLDRFKFMSFSYESFYGGLRKMVSDKWSVWGGVSVIRGGNFRFAEANRAKFFTGADGAYLEADTEFNAYLSSGKPGVFARSNGLGLSAFFGADVKLGKKSIFGASVSDLGFVGWKNLDSYQGNGVYRFEGKQIDDLFGFNDSLFTSYTIDTLASEVGINKKSENFFYYIPTFLRFNYVYYYSRKLFLVTGVDFLINAGALPGLFLKPVIGIGKRAYLHTIFSIGGYGKADLQIGGTAKIGSISGFINLHLAEFLIAPKKSSGQGFSIGFLTAF